MTSYYRDDMAALPEMGVVARQLWRQAGVGPAMTFGYIAALDLTSAG